MKDCTGKELEIGQKVVFTVGTKLVTGTVARVRVATRYGGDYPTTQIRLDVPERRYGQGVHRVVDNTWQYIRGAEKEPKIFRDCYQSDRIMVLDNSKK